MDGAFERCDDAVEALHEALDARIPPERRSPWLLAHLADCPACRARATGLERVDRAGRALAKEWREAREPPSHRPRGVAVAWLAAAAALFLLAGPAATLHAGRAQAAPREAMQGVDALLSSLETRRARFAGGWR